MLNLKNEKILVLGGSSDIGLSLINQLSDLGAQVTAQGNLSFSLLTNKSKNICFEFTKENVDDFFTNFNENEFSGFVNLLGKTDYCFSKNLNSKAIEEITFVNSTINLYIAKHLHKILRNNSSIILISSALADIGEIGMSHYSSANSGVDGIVKSFAREFSYKKIRVNSVKPHLIETRNTHSIPDKIKKQYVSQNLLKRIGTHKDVSDVILFLLSNMSSYITGQTIRVNGGSYL